MSRPHISNLARAFRQKRLVKFSSRYEEGSILGYVLDIGPKFFLLALIGEDMRFNGFQCLRLSDVRNLEAPHRYAEFVEAGLKKRGQRRPKKPAVVLASIGRC